MKDGEIVDRQPSQSLVLLADQPPTVLPAVVVEDVVPFPGPVAPVLIDSPARREAVLHAKNNHGFLALINRRRGTSTPAADAAQAQAQAQAEADAVVQAADHARLDDLGGNLGEESNDDASREAGKGAPPIGLGDLAPVGVAARILRVFQLPDERMSALVQLVRRLQPTEIVKNETFPVLRVVYPAEVLPRDEAYEAIIRQLRLKLQQFFEVHPSAPDEVKTAALTIESPSLLADFAGQHLGRDLDEKLAFLTELDVKRRLRLGLEVAVRELDLITIGNRISDDIRFKVEKHQRDFFLREQLKAIRRELGEEQDPAQLAVQELERKLQAAGLSEEASIRAKDELKRLQLVPTESPEHNVIRSYLEIIGNLPWSKMSDDVYDLGRARDILDADHYGLDEVKQRIVETLAVRQLNPSSAGTILCFAGPPGVGKTSLGQSIARALGRQFYRFSVGGMRDEAEIKGHRRTYIGAMPGRLLQALKQVGTKNPVIMLDEIDKIGSDWRGDPSSALLEVLDPAQNHSFLDHYLDLRFDLSKVMFIATANVKTEIPEPLLDRMEIIDLPGYIPEEKLEIAARHLLPRQRKSHGLKVAQLRVGKGPLARMIREYTHEAGVRELDRQLARLCRKRATDVVEKKRFQASVDTPDLAELLGPPKFFEDQLAKRAAPGVALGLAWTPVGGDVLFIEAASMPGKGQAKITGQLGEVMSESVALAISYVKANVARFGIDPVLFENRDFHLHFPSGAVKKDGPSAGVTITAAIVSLLTQTPVEPRLAMTGEITLRGEVLPVGGIREKIVAARRIGVRTVIVPHRNRADVEQIPEVVRKHLRFVYAERFDDIVAEIFGSMPKKTPTPAKPAAARRRRAVASPRRRRHGVRA